MPEKLQKKEHIKEKKKGEKERYSHRNKKYA